MFSPVIIKSNAGFYGRFGAGYIFNPYLAIETGLSTYPSATRQLNADHSKIDSIYGGDIMGLLTAPMGARWSASAGFGMAITHIHYTAMRNQWDAGSSVHVAPKASIRITSRITKKISLFASGSIILSGGEVMYRDYQPHINMASIGISYLLS